MKSLTGTLVKLGLFALVAVLCGAFIVSALRSPVENATSNYAASFDDVSGLYIGDDVRMSGVQVGKVTGIELDMRPAAGLPGTEVKAKVSFDTQADRPVYDSTQAAVRYQNLLGQRYVELVQAENDRGSELETGSTIALDKTIASFNISTLFNGFEPIFDTLDTDQVNRFAQNVLDLVQGDGSGVGPVLADLDTLTRYAQQRESIILLLVRNLGQISETIGGRSEQVAELFVQLDEVVSRFGDDTEKIIASLDDVNTGLGPLVSILEQLQDVYDTGYGPIDALFHRVVPQSDQIVDLLALTPSLMASLNQRIPNPGQTQTYSCANGQADIPGIGAVVLGNQQLVVCR